MTRLRKMLLATSSMPAIEAAMSPPAMLFARSLVDAHRRVQDAVKRRGVEIEHVEG